MASLRSRATLPWFGRFAVVVGRSVMRSFSQPGQGRQDLGGGGLGGGARSPRAQSLVRRAAGGETGLERGRGADVADPVEVYPQVLRQRAAPALAFVAARPPRLID